MANVYVVRRNLACRVQFYQSPQCLTFFVRGGYSKNDKANEFREIRIIIPRIIRNVETYSIKLSN